MLLPCELGHRLLVAPIDWKPDPFFSASRAHGACHRLLVAPIDWKLLIDGPGRVLPGHLSPITGGAY